MPIREFDCQSCGNTQEEIVFSEVPTDLKCAKCGGELVLATRMMAFAAITESKKGGGVGQGSDGQSEATGPSWYEDQSGDGQSESDESSSSVDAEPVFVPAMVADPTTGQVSPGVARFSPDKDGNAKLDGIAVPKLSKDS